MQETQLVLQLIHTHGDAADNYATDHTYPRTTDPIHDVEVGIVSTTLDTFTINVGITSRVKFNVTNATYDPNSGLVTMTTDTSHGQSTSTAVGFGNKCVCVHMYNGSICNRTCISKNY